MSVRLVYVSSIGVHVPSEESNEENKGNKEISLDFEVDLIQQTYRLRLYLCHWVPSALIRLRCCEDLRDYTAAYQDILDHFDTCYIMDRCEA